MFWFRLHTLISLLLDLFMLLFQPEMLLRWHRELVRKKWTFQQQNKNCGGRPRITPELEALVLHLAHENAWGAGKIQGELIKLGYRLGETTVRDILRRHGILPAPERRHPTNHWSTFLKHYRHRVLACDFFTVETLWLKTLYVFFFIEIGTRRATIAGVTNHPTAPWVMQQARQFIWEWSQSDSTAGFLLRDRDAK
jgi:putative transposase